MNDKRELEIRIYKLNNRIETLTEQQARHKHQFPGIVNARNILIDEVTVLEKQYYDQYK